MKRILKGVWDNFERYVMVFLLLVFLVNVSAQIVSRAFTPLSFTEEISRLAFLWMVFIGISYSTKYDKHIRLTFLTERFPRKLQQLINILITLLGLGAFIWILFKGMDYVRYCSATLTPALRLNKGLYVSILPLTGFLMIVRSVGKLIHQIKDFLRSGKKLRTEENA